MKAKNSNYRVVKGKLGFFGWTARILLLGWQALMLIWFFSYTAGVIPVVENANRELGEIGTTAAAVGVGISWLFIMLFWVGGTIILGIWALLTRPPKTLVPIDQ